MIEGKESKAHDLSEEDKKQNLLDFIDFQLQTSEKSRNRIGISLWILLVALVALSKALIEQVFLIESNDINRQIIKEGTVVVFTIFFLLFSYIYFIWIKPSIYYFQNRGMGDRYLNTNYHMGVFHLKNIISLALLTYILGINIRIFRDNWLMVIIILVLAIGYLIRHSINYSLSWHGFSVTIGQPVFDEKRKIYRLLFLLHTGYLSSALDTVILMSSLPAIYILIGNFIAMNLSKEMLLSILLINLIFFVLGATGYSIMMYFQSFLYERLKKEIYINNLTSGEIDNMIDKIILGSKRKH